MPFAENQGVRLHWQEQGAGSPVLLIMGHRYSSAMWYPILPALAAEHRVISFDNRGTGQSGMTRKTTVGEMVGDALAVMDAAGVQRAHVFGVSMGGGIALELAQQHPERVISLLAGCTCILTADKPRAPAFVRLLYRLPPPIMKLLFPNRRPNHGYGTAAPADAVARDLEMVAKDPFSVDGVIAQAAAIAGYTNTREKVAQLTMPSLVLHGDEDAAVPYAWGVELVETLPASRFVKFEGSGHNFLVADGPKATAEVLGFLREVDGRG
jgi:pimeloyl-ACP methyl ester carboxylesterase